MSGKGLEKIKLNDTGDKGS